VIVAPRLSLDFSSFAIRKLGARIASRIKFEDHSGDKTSAEKLIKALGDFVEPLVKALKK
jgi:hypothetical protein